MKLKETYTNQELVDHVYQYYIVEQNPPGRGKNTSCCYDLSRSNFNLQGKCSIGSTLSDEELNDIANHNDLFLHITDLFIQHPTIENKFKNCTIIKQIQLIHDNSTNSLNFIQTFAQKLECFCKTNKLIYPGDVVEIKP